MRSRCRRLSKKGAVRLTRVSGRFLLDTNIAILLFAQDLVIDLNIALAEEVFFSATALGELLFRPFGPIVLERNARLSLS